MSPEAIERKERKARKETIFSAGFAGFAFPVGLAIVFLALHLPYLPVSLEDLDSINFALGVRRFDVAHHQPHPPGYPVFILIAKAVHAVVPAEATALALVSVAGGTLGVVALAALFRRLDEHDGSGAWPLAAAGFAMTAPLYWFTAARPLTDAGGLAAALAVQAITLSATSARGLAMASFCAGLAGGLRSQVVWLTVPLLIARGLGTRGWGLGGASAGPKGPALQLDVPALQLDVPALQPDVPALQPDVPALQPDVDALRPDVPLRPDVRRPGPFGSGVSALFAFVAGVLVWFVPLILVTGGPAAYWRALSNQGVEDLGNIQMLWTTHNARELVDALYYAFVAPWATWPVASLTLAFGVAGVVWLYRHRPRALFVLAIAFGPYLVFDLLFQETFTSRYALPLVVPMAYLAVAGLRALPHESGLAVAVALAMFDAHVGGTSLAAYARNKAPAFRLIDDMRSAAASTSEPPVLAMDRREDLDFRRPIAWVGEAKPAIARTLPAPPQHEWLEAVRYWNGGGRAPVWFVVDPMRTSIDLVQHREPAEYRWRLPYPVLLSGVRPNEMNWYRVERPEWYAGEGWALTPEAAGVADTDAHGPDRGPITAWVNRSTFGGALMIGGRSFDRMLRPQLTVLVEGRALVDEMLMPGAFLRIVTLPSDFIDQTGRRDYAALTVQAAAGSRVAVEQFDASSERPIFGFGDGWHEQELNPRTGRRWRWLSERGELRVRTPTPRLTLHLEGESPRTYFSRGSRLVVRSGDHVVFDATLSADFSLNVPIANAGDAIVLETDQVYAPADRSRRSADRRHLGLRIFRCELTAGSTADSPQRTPRTPR